MDAIKPERAPDTDRFAIDRSLGAGGMGHVYRAFDRERGDYIALKALDHVEPGALFRFKREFRALTDVLHPNLVTLYELFAGDDSWFFTMELLSGCDFSKYVRRPTSTRGVVPGDDDATRPMGPAARAWDSVVDIDRLRRALPQLVEGVSALHASGHLHRDIKPSNVFVTEEERVVLLDFGVITESSRRHSATAEVLGTPLYMAPERLAADGSVGEPSDWYAVGMMLYVAATGQRPFMGTPADVIRSKREHTAPAPRTFTPDLPPELDELIRGLLEPDPDRRAGADQILQWVGPRRRLRSTPPAATTSQRLVGRGEELAALQRAYEETRRGVAVSVHVHGKSGMGKTALVEHFLSGIGRDTVVLTGRCYERESVPYQGVDSVVDALSQYLAGLPAREVTALLPRDIRLLERLFPVLRRIDAVAEAQRRESHACEPRLLRQRAFAALRELLGRIAAQHPVVVHIDDVQWGDVDAAPLLADLLHPPDAPPVLLVLGYRTEDATRSPTIRLLRRRADRLGSATHARAIEVGPLAQDDACQMARDLLGRAGADTESCDVLARESHGSPYFVEELARHVAASGTAGGVPTLDAAIRSRVATVPEHSRRLLQLVCVAGQPIRLDIVRSAARAQHRETEAVHLLRSQKLVRISGIHTNDTIEAYHDRIRETVVAGLASEQRRALHGRLAAALRRSNADAEQLAWHYRAAGDLDKAGERAIEAAHRAVKALAFDRAANHFEFALDVLSEISPRERGEILVALGNALVNAGRAAAAADAYLGAVATGTRSDTVDLQRIAAEHLLRSGHFDRGMALLRTVLEACRLGSPRGSFGALCTLVMRRTQLRIRGLSFRPRGEIDTRRADLRRVDACSSMAQHVSMIDTVLGAHYQARHVLLALRTGEVQRIVRALSTEVAYSATSGSRTRRRTARLMEIVERLADDAERIRDGDDGGATSDIYRWQEQAPYVRGYTHLTGGVAAYLEGRFADSRQRCLLADEIFRDRCKGVDWEVDTAELFSLFAAIYMGDVGAVRRGLDRRLRECEERGDLFGSTNLRARVSYVPMLADDLPAAARDEVAASRRHGSYASFHLQHYYRAFAECEIDLYEGQGPACVERARRTLRDLRRSKLARIQIVRIESHGLCARGLLAAARGETDSRRRANLLRAARRHARTIERERTVYSAPLSRLLRAGAAAIEGDNATARATLAQATTGFRDANMDLHAAACVVSGAHIGEPPDDRVSRWWARRGIANPERYAAMVAPGFADAVR